MGMATFRRLHQYPADYASLTMCDGGALARWWWFRWGHLGVNTSIQLVLPISIHLNFRSVYYYVNGIDVDLRLKF